MKKIEIGGRGKKEAAGVGEKGGGKKEQKKKDRAVDENAKLKGEREKWRYSGILRRRTIRNSRLEG